MRLQGFRGNCDSQGKLGMCPSLAEPDSGGIPRRTSLRKNDCVRFGKIASLSAFVLFAVGYVVRIAYESFLDYSLLECSLFLE